MVGLAGKSTQGVGSDIVAYLKAVAEFFGATIVVTSGLRSADSQAQAMFDNWVKMNHGACYKNSIGYDNWKKLDEWFITAVDQKAESRDRDEAKTNFLALAKEKMGSRSRHVTGRALDVSRSGITPAIYHAIRMQLTDVPEGQRTDIYHFESVHQVPPVNDDMKAKWQKLKEFKPVNPLLSLPPGAVIC